MRVDRTYRLAERRFWDQWHLARSGVPSDEVHQVHAARFLSYLMPDAEAVLDLGCGQSADGPGFESMGLRVTGLDLSRPALERWRDGAWSCRPTCVAADMHEALPFRDQSFDGVFAYLSLHYFDHVRTSELFFEFRGLLRPGGVLAAAMKSTNDVMAGVGCEIEPNMYHQRGRTRHYFSKDYVEQLLLADASVGGAAQLWEILELNEQLAWYEGHAEESSIVSVIARRR